MEGAATGFANSSAITTFTASGSITGGIGGNAASTGGEGGAGAANSVGATIVSLAIAATGRISGGVGRTGDFGGTEAGGAGGVGVTNGGTIATLTNGGALSGGNGGVGGFPSLSGPQGAAGAGGAGLANIGTITTLTNGGALSGGNGGQSLFTAGGTAAVGVANAQDGTIISFINETGGQIAGGAGGFGGVGHAGGVGATGVANQGLIITLTNSGRITGGDGGAAIGLSAGAGGAAGAGMTNAGTVEQLANSGTIQGGQGVAGNAGGLAGLGGDGLANAGTIGAQTNSGSISGVAGELNAGTIHSLDNLQGGTISGAQFGVENLATIFSFSNEGTISDPGFAVFSAGSIGRIVNSGRIIGNVEIDNQASVTITGALGKTTFGSLRGGTITIRDGDLAFAGGATDLSDDIVVQDGGTVKNNGVLRLAAPETITGGFDQGGAGVLDLALAGDAFGQYGVLAVTGAATLGGELALDPINGFRLGPGDSFDLLSFGAHFGSFTGVSFGGVPCSGGLSDAWTCPAGFNLDISFGSSGLDVITAAVPEPSVLTLMLPGFSGLGYAGWRRRAGRP